MLDGPTGRGGDSQFDHRIPWGGVGPGRGIKLLRALEVEDRQANLLEVVLALTAARGLPCGLNRGEEEADERADDGDDDEEFDEREPCTTGTGHGHGQTFRDGVIRSDWRREKG